MTPAILFKLLSTVWPALVFLALVGIVGTVLRTERKKRTRWKRQSFSLPPVPPLDKDPWPRAPKTDRFQLWKRLSESAAKPKGIDTSRWSLELLQALEWRRFELVCAAYFEALGFRARNNTFGPDGGIDIHLYVEGQDRPSIIVQCKAWKSEPVGVNLVRELYGVMAREKIPEGIFVTTGTYTPDALAFPTGDDLHLLDGKDFLGKLRALTDEQQRDLLAKATEGDFTTPTCASCGIKMISRKPKRGGNPFWGCRNFPRCKQIVQQTAQ